MSYFAKFTILWILYNILACTEQNKETYTKDHSDSVIKVEIENDLLDHLDILPIVDTIIPLEVTENNLIGMVGKIRQYHDDYYIFDVQRRKINVFDNSGRFKYNLGQEGKGPGELVFPGDFFADLSLDAVAVSDIRTGRVNYFNTSGQIIKEIPMAQKGVNFIN
ncbi:MAG TPA: 6-bladed beta-propeller, partial [Sphingobacteriaceae bacterium]|nr:6-bladed beta-propeller [Sphingobacteriaceae bacterium]